MTSSNFKFWNNITGWLVWAIATITYCLTIEPTASFWDCGEYIACAYKLEVGHPPGAPFFLILGRFFTLLAGGSPQYAAMMINIMSALASSFTILFLFWTITRMAWRYFGKAAFSATHAIMVLIAGSVGALAYTFSDSFWFSAVEGEVYAMSSFFTAVVFWAILKWDEEDRQNNQTSWRWIILIAYLIGLSIGVHLLNLLVIPAIGLVVYFRHQSFTWKGFILAGLVSVLVLGCIQNLLIPKLVKFISDYEIFFINNLHLPYNAGTFTFIILLVTVLIFWIQYTRVEDSQATVWYKRALYTSIVFSVIAVIAAASKTGFFTRALMLGLLLWALNRNKSKKRQLNAIFLSLATLLIGYSTFFVLVIRSSANTPMDENDPENAPNMLSYLLREQYGDWPLLYGPYYNAPTLSREQFGDGDPVYTRDEKTKSYRVLDSRKHSIPKYDPEFCTVFPRMWSNQSHHVAGYKMWADVEHKSKSKIIDNPNGETESVQIPNMWANLQYFFSYQVHYMYWRYFMWNFAGRQNDIQGSTNNAMDGNWISGISFWDNSRLGYDTTNPIHRDRYNFATNAFFAIPLILGILGLWVQFKKRREDAWIVLSMFFFTGLAIVIYLNQQPFQPRERDYAYTGSFYAFAIWIGFGALYIFDVVKTYISSNLSITVAAVLGLTAPALMAKDGWNDHDRSKRTMARDMAINYLESCAPNAILFTNGDNDTFPLWYVQEVEGIRTDVRVVNLSLLNTDWYIRQMRRAAYDSKPVPFTIAEEKLEAEKLSYMVIDRQNKTPMNLKTAIELGTSDDPNYKYDAGGGDPINILPSPLLQIPVNRAQVIKHHVVATQDTSKIERVIEFSLANRGYITKNDIMVLDLIAHSDWSRPIYFATTTGDDAYVGLKSYFQLEGLAYRFVPIKGKPDDQSGARIATDKMYTNIKTKFRWGGMDLKGVNLDENCARMTGNLRFQCGALANALIQSGKIKQAREILNLCMLKMPDAHIPFDATMYSVCAAWYNLGDKTQADQLAKTLFDIFEHDLKIYKSLVIEDQLSFGRDIQQCEDVLKGLVQLAFQNQSDLAKAFERRAAVLVSPDTLNNSQNMPLGY